MTDHELNTLFARHVATLGAVESHWGDDQDRPLFKWNETGEGPWHKIPDYVNSADAVLPWLDAQPFGWLAARGEKLSCLVTIFLGGPRSEHAEAPTFPRAAVCALLLAHGIPS